MVKQARYKQPKVYKVSDIIKGKSYCFFLNMKAVCEDDNKN